MDHSKTVYLTTVNQAITGLSPFTLTINPSGISASNKIYKIRYDYGDGSIIDRVINPDNDQDFLNTEETYVYYLTGNIQKTFNIVVNAYEFNTSLYENYNITLDLKAPSVENKQITYPCGYPYFSGFENPSNKYSIITVYDWDTCLFSAGIHDTLPGAPSWLVDGHFTVQATGENVGIVIDATGGYAWRLGNTYTISDIVNIAGYPVIASDTQRHIYGDSYCGNPTGEYIKVELSGLNGNCTATSTGSYFNELHLVGTRMFGTENEVLYMFESTNPNYILPVLVNWKARPIENIVKTIDNSYAPYKLLAPFENEFVTSIDTGTNIVTFPDVDAAPNPDYGSPNMALYEGDGIAAVFLGTVDGNWFNLANWETEGGNNPLFLPNEYVSVKVYAPLNVSAVKVGEAAIINFYEDSLLSQLTVMAAQSAIFNSNSYNLGTIDGDAYFLDNSYNLGFEPTILLLDGQGTDGSNTFTDSSTFNRVLTYTGNPIVTSSPITPNNVAKSIYFDGSSWVFPTSGETDFAFGTNDFTIEGWINLTRNNGTSQVFFDSRYQYYWDGYYHPIMYLRSGTYLTFHDGYNDIIQGGNISLNTWYHVAVSRNGGKTKLFLNGTQTGSTIDDTRNYVSYANRPIIGGAFDNYNFKGYIENFKITKGIAKYTSNFTPSTSALEVDSYLTGDVTGTAFFRDNSINYGTLTNTAFSGNCQNLGTVVNADVYYPTPYPLSGNVTGTLTYHGYVFGCDDSDASNYNPSANTNDGSCTYSIAPLSGLYAYWTLDETSGTRYDTSGNGFDLTESGIIGSGTGIISDAASFVGNWYEYLTNSSFEITAGSDFTICGWINLNSTTFQELISQWYGGYNGNFVITYGENGNNSLGFRVLTSEGDKLIYIEAPINEWVFFAMRWKDGVGLQAKINNSDWHVLSTTATLNGKDWTTFMIGAGESYGYYATSGLIDEIGIWNRKLNEGEINYLYNSGAGRTYPF